jgi:DNA primase
VAGGTHRKSGGGYRRDALDEAAFARRIEDAKARTSLADIITPYTPLKRRGRELVGLCCFHDERTPSMEVNEGKGFYHCFGCGAHGDAIGFLRAKAGLSFMDALRSLEGGTYPEVTPEQRAKLRKEEAVATAARIAEARSVWESGVPAAGTLAEIYCRSRGITMDLPGSVRFAMTPRFKDPETGEVGRDYPAMVCALVGLDGQVIGVQRIFLAPDGKGKARMSKPKLSLGIIVGSSFRAGAAETGLEEIVICEGPEDGLSLAQGLPGRNVWVACGTALMPRVELPASVVQVTLAGDNNTAGRKAVDESRAAYLDQGFRVAEIYPSDGFRDWNDELQGVRS